MHCVVTVVSPEHCSHASYHRLSNNGHYRIICVDHTYSATGEIVMAMDIVRESLQAIRDDIKDLRREFNMRLDELEVITRANTERITKYETMVHALRFVVPGSGVIAAIVATWTWFQTYFNHVK